MKFAVVALIAVVAAADEPVGGGGAATTDDSWKWSVCLKATSCKDGWICCNATKKSDGSKATTGTRICVDPKLSGTVPATAVNKTYRNFQYFCTHTQHKEAVAAAAAAGTTSLYYGASAACVSAYLLA